MKLGGGIAHPTISNFLVGDGVLTGWSAPLAHQVEVVEPAFPPNFNYKAFAWGLSVRGEFPQQQLPVWRAAGPSPTHETSLEVSSLYLIP